MLRTLLKLAIALLILNGAWQGGSAYWQNYQFEDALQRIAQFGGSNPGADMMAQAMDTVRSLKLPVTEDQIAIRKENNRVTISASYKQAIEFVPTYKVPWDFTVKADALNLPRIK